MTFPNLGVMVRLFHFAGVSCIHGQKICSGLDTGKSNETSNMVSMEKEASLRILHHYASSVRYQQYHDTDIITIKVDVS